MLRPVSSRYSISLSDADAAAPPDAPDGDALHDAIDRAVWELGELQELLVADRRYAVLIVLQGRDASGKDGTIKHVFDACNPLGCMATSFKVPTEMELSHDFLWRIHQAVPPRGMIGIFNRSHYEDVMVVRVKQLVPKSVWELRFDQINEFERMLSQNNVVILKFFLHISGDEQKERLEARLKDSTKNWKFRAGDLEDRELWSEYTEAYRDAIRRCSTDHAPWFVVPSDHKPTRNLLITETINRRLRELDLEFPKASKEVLKLRKKIK